MANLTSDSGICAYDNATFDAYIGHNLLQTAWIPFVLTDVVLLNAILLLSAADLTMRKGDASITIDLITLRGMALRKINERIQDTFKSQSDEVFGAILVLAQYEVLFGDIDTYQTHMSGLQRLVQVRGGISALGLDGVLARMLLWVDINGSAIIGQRPCFHPSQVPSAFSHPKPDLDLFGTRYSQSSTQSPESTSSAIVRPPSILATWRDSFIDESMPANQVSSLLQ